MAYVRKHQVTIGELAELLITTSEPVPRDEYAEAYVLERIAERLGINAAEVNSRHLRSQIETLRDWVAFAGAALLDPTVTELRERCRRPR